MGCTVVQTETDTVVTGPAHGVPLQGIPSIDMADMTDAFLTLAVLAGRRPLAPCCVRLLVAPPRLHALFLCRHGQWLPLIFSLALLLSFGALSDVVRCGVAWCGVAWRGLAWRGREC